MPTRTFVLGGARSGKSRFAERLALQSSLDRVYIATAQAFDSEMTDRIAMHLAQRGPAWRTIEAPMDISAALDTVGKGEIALLDCATLWLSNQLLAEADLDAACAGLIASVTACKGHVIVVSNEVGQGIVPDNALGRRFRDAQGRLNQSLAAQADLAVLVTAGLPMVLKGQLP